MADAGEVLFCFFGWRGQHLGLEFTMYTTTRPSARARPLLPSAMTPPPEIPPPFSPPSTHTCTKIQKFNAFRLRKLRWGAHSARRPAIPRYNTGGGYIYQASDLSWSCALSSSTQRHLPSNDCAPHAASCFASSRLHLLLLAVCLFAFHATAER